MKIGASGMAFGELDGPASCIAASHSGGGLKEWEWGMGERPRIGEKCLSAAYIWVLYWTGGSSSLPGPRTWSMDARSGVSFDPTCMPEPASLGTVSAPRGRVLLLSSTALRTTLAVPSIQGRVIDGHGIGDTAHPLPPVYVKP